MQIRRRGNKTEFLRSQYVPEKKASTQKLIGSQDYFLDHLESHVREKMEPEEIEQAEAHFAKQKAESDALSRRVAVNGAAREIKKAAEAIEAGQELKSVDQAIKIYEAMDDLAKQLKRAGYPKSAIMPKKGKKASSPAADDRQTDAFAEGG